jgi:DNA-binding ferritin-like protein
MKTQSRLHIGGKKTRRSRLNTTKKVKIDGKGASFINQPKMVAMFLQMLNTVKLYHWKTSSYSQHKATDELYTNLNTNIDTFVEVMLGKTGGRVNLTKQKKLPLLDYTNINDFSREVEKYKQFLADMDAYIQDSGLLSIRDDLLANLNQFSYLLTFK